MKRWGPRPITDIMPEEVAAAIRAIVKRGAPYQAHNAFGYLRRLFNWAIGTHRIRNPDASPVERLSPKDLIGKREARERTLSDDELRAVWNAAGAMGYPYGPVIPVADPDRPARTRSCATCAGRRSNFDKRLWTIPAERMKGEPGRMRYRWRVGGRPARGAARVGRRRIRLHHDRAEQSRSTASRKAKTRIDKLSGVAAG